MAESSHLTSDATIAPGRVADSGRQAAVIRLAIVVFLYWAALYFYVPTLANYASTKTHSLAIVGTILSMYGLWQMIVRLPLGIAVDWAGRRKPFILLGLALVGLGAWIMGSANSANSLMLGRAVTGLAAAAWVPLVVAFSRLFPPKEAVRASALLTMIGSSGRIFATFSNGPLNNIGGYSLAFDVAVGVAAAAFLIAATSRETPLPKRRPSVTGITQLITRRDVLLPALLNAVVQYANWASTFGFLPILAKGLNASDVTVSTIVSLNLVLGLAGNFGATTMIKRLGAQRLSYLGFILLTVGLGGTAVARSVPMLVATQCLIGLAVGLSAPVLMGMSIRNVDEVERTTAMGLHQAVYASGMFFGPWVSGIMAEAIGVRMTFGFTALACLLLGVIGTRKLVEQMRN